MQNTWLLHGYMKHAQSPVSARGRSPRKSSDGLAREGARRLLSRRCHAIWPLWPAARSMVSACPSARGSWLSSFTGFLCRIHHDGYSFQNILAKIMIVVYSAHMSRYRTLSSLERTLRILRDSHGAASGADIPHLSFKNCSFFNSLRINGLQTRMISANFRQRLLMRLDFGKEPQLLSFLVINRTKLFESVRHFWLLARIIH